MHVILTGATGLVGSGVLDAMIKMKDITKISVLTRRPVAMAEDAKDPRINVIVHKDFTKYDDEVLSKLQGATGCVWALGISQTQVSAEEYVNITKTMALEAASAFQGLGSEEQPFNFVYVSGAGATTTPGRFSQIFARVKGETELALAAMRNAHPATFHAVSVRPAGIDPSAHEAIHAYVPRPPLGYRIAAPVLLPALRAFYPQMVSPTEPLGRFFAELAMGRHKDQFAAPAKDVQMVGEFPILENTVFRRLAGLK
ncbi:nucleoside-diphosphate-sugar epimerase [Xylariales sp. PMI_506]|nr:nucleoside-diphosphate-sugar epimerase [Xylariales sp. PMI_506]